MSDSLNENGSNNLPFSLLPTKSNPYLPLNLHHVHDHQQHHLLRSPRVLHPSEDRPEDRTGYVHLAKLRALFDWNRSINHHCNLPAAQETESRRL